MFLELAMESGVSFIRHLSESAFLVNHRQEINDYPMVNGECGIQPPTPPPPPAAQLSKLTLTGSNH